MKPDDLNHLLAVLTTLLGMAGIVLFVGWKGRKSWPATAAVAAEVGSPFLGVASPSAALGVASEPPHQEPQVSVSFKGGCFKIEITGRSDSSQAPFEAARAALAAIAGRKP